MKTKSFTLTYGVKSLSYFFVVDASLKINPSNKKWILWGSLVGNDFIWHCHVVRKCFFAKFPKTKCDVGQHFWFCCIWLTWWRCVVCTWHMTADLAYFIFYFCDSFKFTNSNQKILNTTDDYHSSLRVLWGGAAK